MNKVAIVMPYYNEPELLLKSVIGVLGQTWTNWHLFIVDDGSVEHKSVLKVLPENLTTKISIHRYEENGGVSKARNYALDIIENQYFDYIAFCDSDDIWSPYHLETSLNTIVVDYLDMVYSDVDYRFVDGSKAVPFGIPQYKEYPGIEKLLEQNFIYISSVVYKKDKLVERFDSGLNSLEDWDYWIRLAKIGHKIGKNNVNFPTIIYTCKPAGNGSKRTDLIYNKLLEKHGIHK